MRLIERDGSIRFMRHLTYKVLAGYENLFMLFLLSSLRSVKIREHLMLENKRS